VLTNEGLVLESRKYIKVFWYVWELLTVYIKLLSGPQCSCVSVLHIISTLNKLQVHDHWGTVVYFCFSGVEHSISKKRRATWLIVSDCCFITGSSQLRFSAWTPAIMTEVFSSFHHCRDENAGTVSKNKQRKNPSYFSSHHSRSFADSTIIASAVEKMSLYKICKTERSSG
jgi:hypothetical protein